MVTDFSGDLMGPHLDLPSALSKIGEESALRDMLGMLADLLAQDVPKIQSVMSTQDWSVASRLLHSIKGCMPIFCTPPICDQLAAVELHAKKGEADLAQQGFATLVPAIKALELEIQHYLATPAASLE
ncbi:MAG: hypothetical protein CFE43_01370 [Burkholderiales bacterium PBB3]|nr:MAG: hypothetical protein CFE43_01370 [Burkholderiales bacterium PBB3]